MNFSNLKTLEHIGDGGFGSVDKVTDGTSLFARKRFAVHTPNFTADLLENVKRRFIREARVQKSITHRNVVPVLEDNLTVSPPEYLMPLALCSLDKDITTDRTIGGQFMRPILDILSGLEELHKIGIYHRDLKPQNVLKFQSIDPAGTSGSFYYAIGDFGLGAVW
jgi:eukaryotic-like serine/threonine-protein kinase